MTVYYQPSNKNYGTAGFWFANGPTMQDLEDMIFEAGNRRFYNFIVVGRPTRISEEWLALHPGYEEGNYDYAVSYAIPGRYLGDLLDISENPVQMFNNYLEDFTDDNLWIQIDRIELVDRKRWKNA